jgi:hypothetical protein
MGATWKASWKSVYTPQEALEKLPLSFRKAIKHYCKRV